jgi:hypothetical protein
VRLRPVALAFALASAMASPALAQLSAQDKAVADTFFDEGLKLLRAGKFVEACPKLAESERIDPAVGTALYLGECFERIGKVASAQAMFQEGYDYAKRRNDGRAAVAKEHHDKLKPSTLAVVLAPGAQVEGLAIVRDDAAMSMLQLGTALPCDGGSHVVVASAPGKKKLALTVTVPKQEGAVTLTIPKLEDEEHAASTGVVVTTPPVSSGSGRRVVGLTIGGIGLAGIVVGSVAGLVATLYWNASNSVDNGCNSGSTTCLTQHGIDLRSSAQTWATVSTVALIAGAALAAIGLIVLLIAPKTRSAMAWTVTPTPAPSGGALMVVGRF